MNENFTSMLVRMPAVLKHALQREAFIQRRSLTAEVVLRLEESIKAARPVAEQLPSAVVASEPRPEYKTHLSESDSAMLDVYRKLPAEKQLALLSLFR